MTRQEYEAKLADLQSQIEELKQTEIEEDIPKPPHPRWKPEYGENFFYCSYSGLVYKILWTNGKLDNGMYNLGNVFRTEEETEFEAERLKVLAEMREWAGHNYDGAYIYYHKPSDEIMIDWDGDSTNCHGDIRFKCVDDAKNCIMAVGKDRLIKYYFGVRDYKSDAKTAGL